MWSLTLGCCRRPTPWLRTDKLHEAPHCLSQTSQKKSCTYYYTRRSTLFLLPLNIRPSGTSTAASARILNHTQPSLALPCHVYSRGKSCRVRTSFLRRDSEVRRGGLDNGRSRTRPLNSQVSPPRERTTSPCRALCRRAAAAAGSR